MASCYLKNSDVARARQTIDLVPPEKANTPAVLSVKAAIELSEKAESLGDLADLAARLDADPQDHQARFDLAVALAGRDQRQEALDQLLDLVRRDRKWNDEAARKQLVKFFEAWGPKDEFTVEGRRKLSSVLFS